MKINTWNDIPAGSVLCRDTRTWVKLEFPCHIAPSMRVISSGGMSGGNAFNIRDWGGMKYFPMQYLT